MRRPHTTRRAFLAQAGSCAAHIAVAAAMTPAAARALWSAVPHGPIVAQEKFGRLEKVADGVWALISTPLTGDRTTLANGGLIAGRTGVLAIEGFFQPAGARWLAERSRELTGKWPTHVALTHYHGDHAHGVAGYRTESLAPRIHATERTRDDVLSRGQPADSERTAALRDVAILPAGAESTLDLGARTVHLVPRLGHTASDLSIEVADPSIVFTGDLVWHGMFPNYVDAAPSRLASAVRALRRDRETSYVPGHGAMASAADLTRYQEMLEEIERAARDAHAAGLTAADAGAAYSLPESLGEWTLFSRAFFERAFAAWYRELGSQ
jgi:glyoxylase-like metal-dependent hydrolase (beta-lactamase superfamily II)